jgi:4-aminobutyrate aminotransferase-like enzyme
MNSKASRILELNAFDAKGSTLRQAPLLRRRLENAGASSVLFYREPIEMVSASGAWMTASDGKRYLDFYNNVPSVGHCHPAVVAAVSAQMARLNIHTRYLNQRVEAYVDRLKATFPETISNVVLTCSGSEANDLAMRIAVKASGGDGFIVTDNAYHGNTAWVTGISPAALKQGAVPENVVRIPAPLSGGAVGPTFAANLRGAVAELKTRGHKLAAFICDSIFSSDGIFSDPAGFLKEAVVETRKAGGLYIADEVQPGFARSGEAFWGFSRHGVVPDIVTMGKPMGNGFPMAGLATRPELLESSCRDVGYFNTFGGNPVAAAAGMAVLDVIEEEGLMQNAKQVGAHLKSRLAELAASKDTIADVRGAGLFIGVDLLRDGVPDARKTVEVIDKLKERGILIGAAGQLASTLKLRPPLCLKQEEADLFADALADVV